MGGEGCAPPSAGRSGAVLIEASIVYLVLSLALAALIPVFLLSIRANKNTERIAAGAQLAAELLEEVRMRRWDELTPTPPGDVPAPSALGLDAGELPADKKTFDDVDDFNGWSESRPKDPVMRDIAGVASFARSVAVSYVDSSFNAAAGATDFKKVTACATAAGLKPVCLDLVLTNR